MPSLRIRAYPVAVRYGLIWLFPGDPALAPRRRLPDVPELEGPDPWAYVPHSFTWRAHHSMVIDNLCDLTHAHLHRSFPSFQPGRLLGSEAQDDRVLMRYEAKVGPLVRARSAAPSVLEIAYEYPYHRARFEWSGIAGRITYWTFLLPLDVVTTRVFFMFCYDRLRIPWLPFTLGHRPLTWLLRLGNAVVRPLLAAGRLRAGGRAARVRGPSRRAPDRAEPRGGAAPPADGPQVGGAPPGLAGEHPRRRWRRERPGGRRRAARPPGAGPGGRPGPRLLVRGGVRPRGQARPGGGGRPSGASPSRSTAAPTAACGRSRIAARTGSSSCRSAT